MRCFYHQEKDAVGTCKSCDKGVCNECAVDLEKGLACRSRCEDSARAVIALIDRNIENAARVPTAQVVAPDRSAGASFQAPDYVATQLSSHIRSTRQFRWVSGALYLVVGVTLLAAAAVQRLLVVVIPGALFLVAGCILLFQAQRNRHEPQLPQTITR
jgi:hypothetical protein